jgi:hypothetical protein
MIKKKNIAFFIFLMVLVYIIAPWIFEKKFLFNELISASGFFILAYKRFYIGRDKISICIVLLLLWGVVHMITSLVRMDSFYYYLRNLVIIYSVTAFFSGFYLHKYLNYFIEKTRSFLRLYVLFFLFVPVSRLIFERFGVATLFPALFSNARKNWVLPVLIALNIIYSFTYSSATSIFVAAFLIFIMLSPSYAFFKQTTILLLIIFIVTFIYLTPYLGNIKVGYSHYTYVGITNVMKSHPLLSIDGNSTWRLVLWKEIIVDDFPANIFGLGFGTPAMKYFPVEDYSKLHTLPYVIGSHNSFVYLFGRLGIVYLLLIIPIYITIFKEYFYFKRYYKITNELLIFYSFFSFTLISLFNPTLESPIYASGYWFILGLLSKSIFNRQFKKTDIIRQE